MKIELTLKEINFIQERAELCVDENSISDKGTRDIARSILDKISASSGSKGE